MANKLARVGDSAQTSRQLREELEEARKHPRMVFGYAHFGERWPRLNKMSGGLQTKTLGVLAARPKIGKSMLAAGWLPGIAEQAAGVGEVVRVGTLETTRKSYQRRAAAIMAEISDPMNIRRGMLTDEEVDRYLWALKWLEDLPIEYLSNDHDMSEEEAMKFGAGPIVYEEFTAFVEQGDTYWWLLDHIGLLADIDRNGDVTKSIFGLANKLATLAHMTAAGLVITHLTRASTTSGLPTIESIAGSDQVGRNADQIFLLSRPFREAQNLTDEEQEMVKDGDPGILQFYSRDEGSGIDVLWWDREKASFLEMDVPDNYKVPLPQSKRKK